MRFLPIILLASVFVNSPLFAGDEKLPPIQQFKSKENADRALNAIIKEYNPDLSHKFKQDALNYLVAGSSRGITGYYYLFSKNAIYVIYKTTEDLKILYKNCELVKDKKNLTRFRCDEENGLYTFVEYENECRSGKCPKIESFIVFEKPIHFKKKEYDTEMPPAFYLSLLPYPEEELLRYQAQGENNSDGYYYRLYMQKYNKDPMQQGE